LGVPKRDKLPMTGTGRTEVIIDAEIVDDVPAASVELVPLSARPDVQPETPLTRPDSSFVAQLIATADRAPQTCALRRGSCADAQAAYGPHDSERRSVARRTKQII
jgi:hypothetical protein